MNEKEAYLREVEDLKRLNDAPLLERWAGYSKYTGPAFMEAVTTLGAGSFASVAAMGAAYGYEMLWIPFYSYLLGMFMFSLGSKFAVHSRLDVITAQNQHQNKLVGSVVTGFIACYVGYVVFTFGQYALGTDALENMFALVGINCPRSVNWIIIFILSFPISWMYGKNDKAVRFVENVSKFLVVLMLLVFVAVIFVTGVDWGELIHGLFIPTLPSGIEGITTGVAALITVVAVGDWCQYHYAMKQRHFTPVHEKLAHFDLVVGGLVPVTLVLTFVGIAFAVTFSGGTFPDDTYELANALVGAIPSLSIQIGFYIGVLAITVSTMIGMSTIAAQSLCRAFGKPLDPHSALWKFGIISTQIGFLGAYIGKPMWAVILVAGLQSCFSWVSGSSWFLLANDRKFLGKHVVKNYLYNLGILVSVIVLNLTFVIFVLTKLGVWA